MVQNFTYKKNRFTTPIFRLVLTVSAFILLTPVLTLNAQNGTDPVLLNIAGENITKSEFLSVYQKNNVNGEVLDKKSLEEYLDLFINFKLKVREATDMGLDTAKSFINELKGYRDQLAKPYFVDEEVNKELLQQAYERKNVDVRVSHILVRVEKFAKPADTLAALKKIEEIRARIMKGENFNNVAAEVSEDPSARDMPARGFQPARKGNRGDIGYFSVFDMVYPFEEAAFSLPVGEVSKPVRTDFGYHLILVTNKRPALGKVQVAHLFLQIPANATHQDSVRIAQKADSLYKALVNGADWDQLVSKFSDDKSSAMNKGVLPWFGSNRMVPEFIDGIATLKKIGDFSKPVLTSYGWHLIRLVDRKPIGTFEEEKTDLKQSLAKDTRSNKSKESIIRRIKDENNFVAYPNALKAFYSVMDSSIYKRKWDKSKAASLTDVIFKLGNENYTQQQFADYLYTHQTIATNESYELFIKESFDKFVEDEAIAFEDARLEQKYPEFKSLVNEYRDGILLFELTDQKVWSKAIKDTTGLKEFYQLHHNEYMWDDRIDATLITAPTQDGAEKALKLANAGKDGKEIQDALATDSLVKITVVSKKFPKNDNDIIDEIKWKKGVSKIVPTKDGKFGFAIIHALVGPEPKTLSDARGLITADYQNYLEQEWIKDLKKKYTVTVNQDVLSQIK